MVAPEISHGIAHVVLRVVGRGALVMPGTSMFRRDSHARLQSQRDILPSCLQARGTCYLLSNSMYPPAIIRTMLLRELASGV